MPLDSQLVTRARELARVAHENQLRKANGKPYFTHLEAVADLLVQHGYDDDETLAVAYLHDLLEDQPEHGDALRAQMPAEVVERVEVLSEQKHDERGRPLAKSGRFRGYVEGLGAGTDAALRALPVSCADRIHNSSSLVADERAGHRPFMRLRSRPGELLAQLERLRELYQGKVNDALLESFDRAAAELGATIERWLPGRAVAMAAEAHLGQFDKSGAPYIYHPVSLALSTHDEDERIVALLHDTIEDTSLTLEALEREGFSPRIVRAVEHLTRRDQESYEDFIERVKKDRLATRVKLLDLAHNADLSRIASPNAKDRERRDKYLRASEELERELEKRSLQVVLDDASRARLRAHKSLPVFKAHHVTLAHRVLPSDFDPAWVPGNAAVGSTVEVRVVGKVKSDRVEAALVQIAGSSVRPIDGGTLHVTLSRIPQARSRDANALFLEGEETPLELDLRGVLEWVDC